MQSNNGGIYYLKDNAVSDNFIDEIIKTGESKILKPATIGHKNNIRRKSKISWLDNLEIKKPLSQLVNLANKENNWNYSLKEFENLQYTIYHEGDHYNWHTDSHDKPYADVTIRKISFTLCLNDDYEGGNFEICDPHPIQNQSVTTTFVFKKGTMIVFPSHIWHRVKPVTKGIRRSLVGWVVGRPFI
tara:strand:+ start:52 stop:612 length:561 start_codon:yes stop_codon:yes gene_type:complete